MIGRFIEKWKPIVGYENYEISNLGRVRHSVTKRVRSLHCGIDGRPQVALKCEKKKRTFRVQNLVANAFIGKKPSEYDVNHIDGVKSHNWYWNLEYLTRKENILHGIRLGILVPARAGRLGGIKAQENKKKKPSEA